MKKVLFVVSVFFAINSVSAQDLPKNTRIEEVKKICQGLSKAEKPIVAVMPFKIAAPGAAQVVGSGLPDMLVNAIFNTNCFRVVERDRLNDIMKEQGLGLSGAGDENSFAQVGKLAGAQILVFGTVTEFKENESGGRAGAVGGRLLGSLGKLGVAAGGVASSTSHIGYTLKFVDPTTGELLDTKSFDKKKTAVGVAGGGLFAGGGGVAAGGGGFYSSKSMQDAVEESLIEAIEYMSQNKSAYAGIAGSTAAPAVSNISANDCALVKSANKPAIVVILPEEHITGQGGNYDPYRNRIDITINHDANGMARYISTVPCQAGETEISRKLTEFGFKLKDATQLEKLKNDQSFQNAYTSSSDAAKIGSLYKVDMIIVGEAFSEYSKNANGLVSCRATVNVKAVMTKDATIIATQSFKASGLDATEVIAGKTAIQNACTKLADYLQNQFCLKGDDIVSSMGKPKATGSTGTGGVEKSFTDVTVLNVDYTKLKALTDALAAKGIITEKTLKDNNGHFKLEHAGSSDLIAEFIETRLGTKFSIKGSETGSLTVAAK